VRRLLAFLVFLAICSPAGAAPQLAGTNVLTSTGPGAIEVELPLPVTLDMTTWDNPSVSVTGSAPVVGFVLRQIPAGDGQEEVPFAVIGARGKVSEVACEGRPCDGNDELMISPTKSPDGGLTRQILLEPGRYMWSAISDGSPVTVTLTFADLLGELHVQPTHAWGARVAEPEGRTGDLGETTFGAADVLASRGMLFGSMSVRATSAGVFEDELCIVPGREAAEGEEQSCSDALVSGIGTWVHTEGEGWALSSTMAFMLDPGDWSVVGRASSTPPLASSYEAAVVGAWIPYYATTPLPASAPAAPPVAQPAPAATATPPAAPSKATPPRKKSKQSKAACKRKAKKIRNRRKRRAALRRCG
jgi:hypothetical protein